jgi:hypothetical protein
VQINDRQNRAAEIEEPAQEIRRERHLLQYLRGLDDLLELRHLDGKEIFAETEGPVDAPYRILAGAGGRPSGRAGAVNSQVQFQFSWHVRAPH